MRTASANNECHLAVARCSIALSRFGLVSNRILKYLKVCTHSIMSPLKTNSWHGLVELNTMTFFFHVHGKSTFSTELLQHI